MQTNSTTQVNTTASSVASPDVEIYDVVVIGAGPIGLATAIGLRQRGIDNILVIDQARAFRQVGQVIDLLPNGLKALKAIARSAYEAVKRQGLGFAKPTQTQDEATSQPLAAMVLSQLTGRAASFHLIRVRRLAKSLWRGSILNPLV